ncbi:VIR protein [Plasmodium vivax]|uniref:VIR protein n=1 Tax=Plasmodium vivax TaxID=5855 RepID=A0A1G4EDN4_PLAVI|nr:VIR protein [Plasmodium vivax]
MGKKTEKYKKYIQGNPSLYTKFEDLFFKDDQTYYKTYYDGCQNYDISTKMYISNCSQNILRAAPPVVTALQDEHQHEESKGKEPALPDQEEASPSDLSPKGLSILPQGDQQSLLTLPGGEPESDPVEIPDDADDGILPSPIPNTSIVTPMGLSLFGIASLSTILYKYTPLRSVFDKLIHKNRSPINNFHEVPEELLEYMIKSGGKNRDNGTNYIAYQPT